MAGCFSFPATITMERKLVGGHCPGGFCFNSRHSEKETASDNARNGGRQRERERERERERVGGREREGGGGVMGTTKTANSHTAVVKRDLPQP